MPSASRLNSPAALPAATPSTNGNAPTASISGQHNDHGHAVPATIEDNPASDQLIADPVHEAELLRDALRTVLHHTNRPVTALRRHKKHSRLSASAITSLRELRTVKLAP